MQRTRLAQLVVFAAVAETGGFRAAADRLGIAPSAVSHAVSTLEQKLGLRLLARTTRATRLTEEGQRLLDRVSGPLNEIETGIAEILENAGAPAGPLRITLPSLALERLVMARLPTFFARYPAIELDLRVSDVFQDIVESGCDAGIRLGESLQADMIAVPLSDWQRQQIVASPGYFSQHPKPVHPRDLAAHNCIRRRFDSGRIYRWQLQRDGQPISVAVTGNLILPRQRFMRQAALDGLGLAFLFAETIECDLREGRLVAVLDDWCPAFDGYYLYYPSRRQMRPALRAFIDFFRYRLP